MTADTLKTTRVLELYQNFISGKLINKQQAAEQYHVNVRSIQRDIDSIRDFLSEQCAKEGIVRKIEYDKKENGYRLVTQEIEQLSKGEVLALCKILLESSTVLAKGWKSCCGGRFYFGWIPVGGWYLQQVQRGQENQRIYGG